MLLKCLLLKSAVGLGGARVSQQLFSQRANTRTQRDLKVNVGINAGALVSSMRHPYRVETDRSFRILERTPSSAYIPTNRRGP